MTVQFLILYAHLLTRRKNDNGNDQHDDETLLDLRILGDPVEL